MISADELWPRFLEDAKLYEKNKEIYYSPTEAGSYQIEDTQNDIIRISRVNVSHSGETMSITKFRTIISRINNYKNFIPKGTIYEHVAEEVTVVELLPFLDWSENGRHILNMWQVNGIPLDPSQSEAKNDDPKLFVQVRVKQRLGQRMFRDKLLKAYEGKCAISGCTIKEVLHACHINPHNVSGINISNNGLILRSDIHDLFDQNLIGIDPYTLKLKVSQILVNSEYFNYNNVLLANRNDGKKPWTEALSQRWENFIK